MNTPSPIHVRVTALLNEERANGYSEAFRAVLSRVVMMAGFMAGSGKLSKREASDLRNLVGGMIGDAVRDLPPEPAARLQEHARAVMEDLLARLGRTP